MPVYKKINRDFFKVLTTQVAYVLGFFAADGGLTKTNRGTYFITFNSADRGLIEVVKKAMGSEHKISKRISDNGVWYRLQIGSKEMFHDILKIGLGPNKAKRMRIPKIPKSVLRDFVRGYFDGDGNVWHGLAHKNSLMPNRVLQVAFTSASQAFLHDLHSKLRVGGIIGGSIVKVKDKNCHRLQLSTSDALKLYEIMYNVPHRLYLKRKRLVFEKFIKMRA